MATSFASGEINGLWRLVFLRPDADEEMAGGLAGAAADEAERNLLQTTMRCFSATDEAKQTTILQQIRDKLSGGCIL